MRHFIRLEKWHISVVQQHSVRLLKQRVELHPLWCCAPASLAGASFSVVQLSLAKYSVVINSSQKKVQASDAQPLMAAASGGCGQRRLRPAADGCWPQPGRLHHHTVPTWHHSDVISTSVLRTYMNGCWSPGKSKLRTFNAKLDQEGPAQTSWCSEWAVHVSKPSSM
jgi:hypothetical protein